MTSELPPLGNEGICPGCGRLVWSGGPPTEGEFPLTCRFCESIVERPRFPAASSSLDLPILLADTLVASPSPVLADSTLVESLTLNSASVGVEDRAEAVVASLSESSPLPAQEGDLPETGSDQPDPKPKAAPGTRKAASRRRPGR